MTTQTTQPTTIRAGVPLDTLLEWATTPPRSFTQIEDFWNLEAWLNEWARRLAEQVADQLAHDRYANAISPACTIADICLAQSRLATHRRARYNR